LIINTPTTANISNSSTQIAELQVVMRPQNINLAYAETMKTCLAIEHDQKCLNNPRWIEEDWSEERLHALQRERHDFEQDPEFCSREQRIELSKRIIHGQVCLYHYHNCAERLHILQMIRGDAKGDLNETATIGVRSGRVRTTAARAARKKAVRAARSLTPEQGRQGGENLRDEFESTPSSLSGMVLVHQMVWTDTDASHRWFQIIDHCHISAQQRTRVLLLRSARYFQSCQHKLSVTPSHAAASLQPDFTRATDAAWPSSGERREAETPRA
jgi:hypothetical protein